MNLLFLPDGKSLREKGIHVYSCVKCRSTLLHDFSQFVVNVDYA